MQSQKRSNARQHKKKGRTDKDENRDKEELLTTKGAHSIIEDNKEKGIGKMANEIYEKLKELKEADLKRQEEKAEKRKNRGRGSRFARNFLKYGILTAILLGLAYIGATRNMPFLIIVGLMIYVGGSIFIQF